MWIQKPDKISNICHQWGLAIEQDMERLEYLEVIERVPVSDWAAPSVPIPQADGSN